MKKNAGFTLVELIVVIAILAILAGIAIPVYSGYISKAKEAADYQKLDAIKTAAVFTSTENAVKAGTDPIPEVKYIEVTEEAVKAGADATTATALEEDEGFLSLLGQTSYTFDFESGATKAVWTAATTDKAAGWELTKGEG